MTRRELIGTLALGTALLSAACSRTERSAEEGTTKTAGPALWDPVDPSFKGCEGG